MNKTKGMGSLRLRGNIWYVDYHPLQSILGHATAQMTQRYAHLANSHLAVNMEIFDAGMTAVKPQFYFDPSQIRPKAEKDLLDSSLKLLNIN
mgnify:CR=1 FL=1